MNRWTKTEKVHSYDKERRSCPPKRETENEYEIKQKEKDPYCPILVNDNEPIALDRNSWGIDQTSNNWITILQQMPQIMGENAVCHWLEKAKRLD